MRVTLREMTFGGDVCYNVILDHSDEEREEIKTRKEVDCKMNPSECAVRKAFA